VTAANAALLEASGLFGLPIDPGPGSPDDVRLLGLLGRSAEPQHMSVTTPGRDGRAAAMNGP